MNQEEKQEREWAKTELQNKTKEINHLLEARRIFVFQCAPLFAKFKIGQKVINKKTLRIGKVIGYYQATYGKSDQIFWESFNIHCRIQLTDKYDKPLGIVTNTSGSDGRHWVDFEEYEKAFKEGVLL